MRRRVWLLALMAASLVLVSASSCAWSDPTTASRETAVRNIAAFEAKDASALEPLYARTLP